MLHSINSFPFEKFSLNFKETFIKISSAANFINKPKVFFIFNRILKACNMFWAFLWPCTCYQPSYLKFYDCRGVTLLTNFGKLFHCDILTNCTAAIHSRFYSLTEPYNCNPSFSKNSNLLVPIWASVTELLFFTITHQDFFLWRLLHGGLGCSNIRKLQLMINLLLLHYQSFFTFWGMSCKFFRIGLGLWRLF